MSFLALAVVSFCPSLVTDEFWVLAFSVAEALLLWAFDAVTVGFVGLVTCCVILLFDHC